MDTNDHLAALLRKAQVDDDIDAGVKYLKQHFPKLYDGILESALMGGKTEIEERDRKRMEARRTLQDAEEDERYRLDVGERTVRRGMGLEMERTALEIGSPLFQVEGSVKPNDLSDPLWDETRKFETLYEREGADLAFRNHIAYLQGNARKDPPMQAYEWPLFALCGPPGIGKSRMLDKFVYDRINGEGVAVSLTFNGQTKNVGSFTDGDWNYKTVEFISEQNQITVQRRGTLAELTSFLLTLGGPVLVVVDEIAKAGSSLIQGHLLREFGAIQQSSLTLGRDAKDYVFFAMSGLSQSFLQRCQTNSGRTITTYSLRLLNDPGPVNKHFYATDAPVPCAKAIQIAICWSHPRALRSVARNFSDESYTLPALVRALGLSRSIDFPEEFVASFIRGDVCRESDNMPGYNPPLTYQEGTESGLFVLVTDGKGRCTIDIPTVFLNVWASQNTSESQIKKAVAHMYTIDSYAAATVPDLGKVLERIIIHWTFVRMFAFRGREVSLQSLFPGAVVTPVSQVVFVPNSVELNEDYYDVTTHTVLGGNKRTKCEVVPNVNGTLYYAQKQNQAGVEAVLLLDDIRFGLQVKLSQHQCGKELLDGMRAEFLRSGEKERKMWFVVWIVSNDKWPSHESQPDHSVILGNDSTLKFLHPFQYLFSLFYKASPPPKLNILPYVSAPQILIKL